MIRLPQALEADFRQELYAYEEQRRMLSRVGYALRTQSINRHGRRPTA